MKRKIFLVLLLLILCQFRIFAQDDIEKKPSQVEVKEDNPAKEGKTHHFGITIKRMNYTYIPAEYHFSKTPNLLIIPLSSSSELKKNEQVTLPFAISYYNKNWNLFIEASHYKVTYNNVNYRTAEVYHNPYFGSPKEQIRVYDTRLSPKTRRESKINFYKRIELNESNSFFYGLGIRNIYKGSHSISRSPYGDYGFVEYKDYIDSYGLQFFLKYQYQFTSSWKTNLTLEPFLTYGIWKSQGFGFSSFYFPNSLNAIYGMDIDLQLAYNLNENLNLIFGYNYIYTKVRGYAILPTILPTATNVTESDNIYGYYFGLNSKF